MQIAAHLSGIAENSALLMKCNQITANNERDARSGSGSALTAITSLVHKTLKSKRICRSRKINQIFEVNALKTFKSNFLNQ